MEYRKSGIHGFYVRNMSYSSIQRSDLFAEYPAFSCCRFEGATSFNGDLSKWITENVEDMIDMYVLCVLV